MATDIFDNVPHKLTPDGRLVPDFGPPPLMREPPDPELAYWNGEIAARDATICRLRAALDVAEGALANLVAKLDEINAHPAFQSVFTMAAIHGAEYQGPNYSDALERARAALDEIRKEKG
jgi:hypothetical protein